MINRIRISLISCLFLLQGCSSAQVNVFPLPPQKYEVLGRVTGLECGSLVLLGSFINFIPVQFNSRLERAYEEALNTIPGTTSLADVDVHEDWFWWILGTTRCTVLNANAIREARS